MKKTVKENKEGIQEIEIEFEKGKAFTIKYDVKNAAFIDFILAAQEVDEIIEAEEVSEEDASIVFLDAYSAAKKVFGRKEIKKVERAAERAGYDLKIEDIIALPIPSIDKKEEEDDSPKEEQEVKS